MQNPPNECLIDRDYLFHALDYCPATGVFRWKINTSPKGRAGNVAGALTSQGYIDITIDCVHMRAARLAWLFSCGRPAEHVIDHINGIRTDNRIDNLRDVPMTINARNRKNHSPENSIPFLGVSISRAKDKKRIKSYRSRISWTDQDGRHVINLGSFKTPEEAHAAYLEAKSKYHVGAWE